MTDLAGPPPGYLELLEDLKRTMAAARGRAPSPAQLPAADSELAQQLTRDPYVLDVLDSTGTAEERT